MSEIYLPNDLWKIIKIFIFHDIKYGKHLKKDKYIIKYNNIIKTLPKKKIPSLGIRIIFSQNNTETRNYKYIYYIPLKNNKRYFIIEILSLPKDYKSKFKKYDEIIYKNYYNFLDP